MSQSDSVTFSVRETQNTAPVIDSATFAGGTISVTASDEDGDSLTFSATVSSGDVTVSGPNNATATSAEFTVTPGDIIAGGNFVVNVVACFLLGLIVARLGSATGAASLVYSLLGAGFCGGLSTLSTAAADIVQIVRRGAYSIALAYLMLTVGTGMGALWVGLVLAS